MCKRNCIPVFFLIGGFFHFEVANLYVPIPAWSEILPATTGYRDVTSSICSFHFLKKFDESSCSHLSSNHIIYHKHFSHEIVRIRCLNKTVFVTYVSFFQNIYFKVSLQKFLRNTVSLEITDIRNEFLAQYTGILAEKFAVRNVSVRLSDCQSRRQKYGWQKIISDGDW